MFPFLVALGLYDLRTLRKLHPATLVCAMMIVPAQVAGAWIARSEWWNGVAPGVLGAVPG